MSGEDSGDHLRRGRPSGRTFVIGTVLALGAAAALVVAVVAGNSGHSPGANDHLGPTSAATGSSAPTSTVGGTSVPGVSATPSSSSSSSVPVTGGVTSVSDIGATGSSLIIPKIGVDAELYPTGAVGAPETAALTIPEDIHTVAWWDGTVQDGGKTVQEDAPKPGQPGVALIAGHIDAAGEGPGALYNLKDLVVGDEIEIVDSNRQTSTWAVSAPPDTTLKTELPSSLWVTTGPPKLALVTCGGPFDSATGHYVDNVIVWASPKS
jgi:hypothetical protein